jgi:L-ascorbate metabolism protein UlaG (beta-lactamase superfamily)
MPFKFMTALFISLVLFAVPAKAQALSSDCLAVAEGPASVQLVKFTPAVLAETEVQLTFVGHSTFLIESAGGVRIATDFAGYAGGITPDVVTMNRAHSSHNTSFPDPAIKHVLRGWNPEGGRAEHNLSLKDVYIRNVTTDIRGGQMGRIPDGNSIFIFEIAGLCIGHVGHLHHELTPQHIGQIGRLDIMMVPVDGGYTMAQVNMMQVVNDLKASIVIPMHYFGPTTLSNFISNARATLKIDVKDTSTLTVSRKTLPKEPTLVVLPGY